MSREEGKGACFLSVLEHECDVTSLFKFLPMTGGNLGLWSKRNPFLPSSFMLQHLSQPQRGNEGMFVLCDILQSHLIKACWYHRRRSWILGCNHGMSCLQDYGASVFSFQQTEGDWKQLWQKVELIRCYMVWETGISLLPVQWIHLFGNPN